MTSTIQEIQVIRSLKRELREPTLPINILNAIASIHTCIEKGTDLDGWRRVNVKGSGKSGYTQQSKYSSVQKSNSVSTPITTAGKYRPPTASFASISSNKAPNTPIVTTPPVITPPPENIEKQPVKAPFVRATQQEKLPPAKYVSKFKKSSEKVDDTILNTILLGKLNKFSAGNYDEIKEFITHIIDSGQTEMIKCFMKLLFEKAASEEMFCPLYAKLLSELSSEFPVLLDEMANLYSQYTAIFEEVNEADVKNYDEMCKRNTQKKYRRGYSQFLAELIKYNVIDTDLFTKTISTIIKQIDLIKGTKDSTKLIEEYGDCLMKIMKALQGKLTDNIKKIRSNIKSEYSPMIKPFTEKSDINSGISTKARFTFLDIYESTTKF